MTVQNYLIIENDIVTNIVMWDGDTKSWMPPADSITKIKDEVPAKVWRFNPEISDFEIQTIIGASSIGFTWDGTYTNTNREKPTV